MNSPVSGTIDPGKLDLVMRDADFVIYYGAEPLTTPGGSEVSHADSRLLKHLLIKLTLAGRINYHTIDSYTVFAFIKDFQAPVSDSSNTVFDQIIAQDPLLQARLNPGENIRIFAMNQVLDDPEENHRITNLMFMGASVILKGFRDFLTGMEQFAVVEKDYPNHRDEVVRYIRNAYNSLTPESRGVVTLFSHSHQNGILLPLLLVKSAISPSEYALASLAAHTHKMGKNAANWLGYTMPGASLEPVNVNWEKPEESLRIFHDQALKILEFLSFFGNSSRKMPVIAELISQGEHDKLEFKSTFRWDLRQDKKNPAIEHAALKSVSAFLNSEGGDLLVGVADDGTVLGVENDHFPSDDKFLLHVWNLIKSSFGQDISPYIKTTLEKVDGKTVCRFHCLPGPKPVFLRQAGFDETFYIRVGPSTGSLGISEALKYIAERF